MSRDELLAEVEFLLGTDHPENIARRLGVTVSGIEKAARARGKQAIAVAFTAARWGARSAA